MSRFEARILTEDDYDQWDTLVRQSGQGTIFHSSDWITLTAKYLRSGYALIGVFNGSELIGGCFFYVKRTFSSLKIGYTTSPLMPWGGFVLPLPKSTTVHETESREREIIELILEKIRPFNLFRANIVNSPGFRDVRPFKWQGWTESVSYTYVISLDGDIFSNISSHARSNIRKAQRHGITVTKNYDPERYWELTKLTYDKQNMKIPFQKEYLFSLMEMLIKKNLGAMWIAEMPSGEPASAIVIIDDTPLAYSWVGANNPSFKNTGVTSLMEFETYRDLQKRGFHQVNLMGANFPALSNFYSQFNPVLVPYYSVQRTKGIQRLLNFIRYAL
jgi:hypothetical protein